MTARRCVGSTCGAWRWGSIHQAQRRITAAGANVSVTLVQPNSHKYEAFRGVPLPVCMSLSAPHSLSRRIVIEDTRVARIRRRGNGRVQGSHSSRYSTPPPMYITRPQKSFSTVVVNEIVRSHVHLLAELMLAWITPDFAISLKEPLIQSTMLLIFHNSRCRRPCTFPY
jgi:hypothetical protein